MTPLRLACVILLVAGFEMFVAGPASAETTYTWIGNTQDTHADNHSWGDQHNWNPTGVPADGDSVVISQPSQDDCFAHVDGVPTVSLTNFTLTESPALCTVSVSGGAISVGQFFTWDGGQLDTPTTISAGAVANVSGSDSRLNTLSQDLDVLGTLSLTGVSGDGALRIGSPRVLHIEPGATLASSGDNTIEGATCCTNPAKVVNEDTMSISGGTLTLTAVELDQKGSVIPELDATLLTTAAPVTAVNGDYSGHGRWLLANRSDARFSGTQHLGHDFHLELGGVGSTFSSSLGGVTSFAGTGTFDWTGGVLEAELTIDHGVSVQVAGTNTGGTRRMLSGKDFSASPALPVLQTNHGTITVSDSATIITENNAHLINGSDGTISLAPGTSFGAAGCCVSPDRLRNVGTLEVPSATAAGPVVIENIEYQAANGASTKIASGRTLQLVGGAVNKLDGVAVSGGGRLSLTAPTAVVGNVPLTNNTRLVIGDHGSMDGTATLAGNGSISWTSGSMSGNLTIKCSGGLSISGTDIKSIRNIGGGSAPSKVSLQTETSVAAGTSKAHDTIDLGHSRLIVEAPMTAGAFTDFASNTLTNRATLTLPGGTVSAYAYTQAKTGKLVVDLAKGKHTVLMVSSVARLRGRLIAHNVYRPSVGTKLTVLKAHDVHNSLKCVRTTGTGASGPGAGHWAAKAGLKRITLTWRRGAQPAC